MTRILNIVLLTIIFIIGMFVFNVGKNIEKVFENVMVLNWFGRYFWNIFIPIIIADLSIFIWLVIEWIRMPKNVTEDE